MGRIEIGQTVGLISANIQINTEDWVDNEAAVNVAAVTPNSVAFISPQDDSAAEYISCGVEASQLLSGEILFICEKTPANTLYIQATIFN